MKFVCGALVVLAGLTAAAAPPPASSALVTQVRGEAFYRPPVAEGEAPPAPVQPFMKARVGDVYTLAQGGTLRLVYLLSGRQELWKGPAELEIGRQASTTRSAVKPVVTTLPEATTRGLQRMPTLLKRSGMTRLGAARVRGDNDIEWRDEADLTEREQKTLAEARRTFDTLRKELGPADPTPDFYLIGTLARLRIKAPLVAAVQEALGRFPKDATLLKLHRWLVPPKPTAN